MELANILNELWRRRTWLAVGLVLAVAAPIMVIYELPSFEKKGGKYGVATTDILVSSQQAPIANVNAELEPLVSRAAIYSRLVGSQPVKDRIARIARLVGVPAADLVVNPPAAEGSSGGAGGTFDSTLQEDGYFIATASGGEGQPVLTISTQAPTSEAATRLADATAAGLAVYIREMQQQDGIPGEERANLEQLGGARGGLAVRTVDYKAAVLAYLGVFVGWCLVILFAGRLIAGLREVRGGEKQASPRGREADNGDAGRAAALLRQRRPLRITTRRDAS